MTIETKFDIGQEVWVMYKNKPTRLTIGGIDISVRKGRLELDRVRAVIMYYMEPYEMNPLKMSDAEYIPYNRKYYENNVFLTKEELLKSL